MAQNITGVILAGGAGKRFDGIIKANIVIDGKTIISRIIETINDIFDEMIIVTNTPEKFNEYGDNKIIVDKILNEGPLGGIHSAMKESENEAVFVFAGDMPLLDREIIIRQIDFYNAIIGISLFRKLNNILNLFMESINTIIGILEDYLKGYKLFYQGVFSVWPTCAICKLKDLKKAEVLLQTLILLTIFQPLTLRNCLIKFVYDFYPAE